MGRHLVGRQLLDHHFLERFAHLRRPSWQSSHNKARVCSTSCVHICCGTVFEAIVYIYIFFFGVFLIFIYNI